MANNAAQDIRDDLIPHDVDLRKVDGQMRRECEARLDQLGRDLKLLAVEIDPHGAQRTTDRDKRLGELERRSRELIRQAYSEIAKKTGSDLRRIARAESRHMVRVVGDNLP